MRKIYLSDVQKKDSDYWDANWASARIEDAVEYCDLDYLKPYLLRYFPKKGKILEGGCGLGQYVIYYKNLGYDIIGVDFAAETVRETKEKFKDISIDKQDVRSLDFQDGFFEAYYSGGVIEHFEEGPDVVIREANRVLRQKGIFIVTVPYVNIARKITDFIMFRLLRNTLVKIVDHNGIPSIYIERDGFGSREKFNDFHFHEYAFEKKEINRIVSSRGFRLIFSVPVGISWGIKDFAVIKRVFRKICRNKGSLGCFKPPLKDQGFLRGFLKKIIISESYSDFISTAFISIMRRLFGHMILMVYEKEGCS